MTTREPSFPPHIMAALRSPEGTTVEDIYQQFPDARPTDATPTIDHNEFKTRLLEALDDWHRHHGWHIDMPPEVNERLAQQILDEITRKQR